MTMMKMIVQRLNNQLRLHHNQYQRQLLAYHSHKIRSFSGTTSRTRISSTNTREQQQHQHEESQVQHALVPLPCVVSSSTLVQSGIMKKLSSPSIMYFSTTTTTTTKQDEEYVQQTDDEKYQEEEEKVLTSACGDINDDEDDDEDEMEEMFVDAYETFEHQIPEWGGPRRGGRLPEPTRYGDWERKGRCTDF